MPATLPSWLAGYRLGPSPQYFSGYAWALRLDKMLLSLKQFFRNFALMVAVKVESRKKKTTR
jgi:hypothetical protein